MAADVNIVIASEFVGAKAFKDADKVTTSLSKQVNTLAKSYLGLYSVQRLARSGFNAAKAFAEDDKAARVLGQTLNNLGLGFGQNAQVVNDYISNLEKQTGVLDDELRPAMDRLLRATGSITRSQKLLNLALDISAGTGKSLGQVTQSLQKGYLGQTQALGRLGVGLSKAELTTASFEEIQTRLAVLFEGQAAMAADTYIGKMNKLTVAVNNAKETIGSGLVDALAKVGGGSTVDDAVENLDKLARGFNAIVGGAATAIGFIVKLGKGLEYITSLGGLTGSNGRIAQYTMQVEDRLRQFDNPRSKSPAGTALRSSQSKTAEAAATKRAKDLAALQKKQIAGAKSLTAEQTKQLALQKAGTLFDLQQTQIIAALKGNITDEERKRLELQLAILTGNTAEASKLAEQLGKAQGLTEGLRKYLADMPNAKNPFEAWKLYLDAIEAQARRIANVTPIAPVSIAGNNTSGTYSPAVQAMIATTTPSVGVTSGGDVVVNIAGNVVSEADLVEAVRNGLLERSLSGSASSIGRLKGSFAPQ